MVFLTRRERFNAGHRMYREEWDDAKNFEVFGKCANPNWHGHNYILWVTVKGDVDPQTGYAMNLKELSQIIKTFVIDKIDHKNINIEVDFMQGKIASSENLAVAIWNELEEHIAQKSVRLHSIKIQETENNIIEYYGD